MGKQDLASVAWSGSQFVADLRREFCNQLAGKFVLLVNRDTPGLVLAASGILLNVLVVLANGAMPVLTDWTSIAQRLGDHANLGTALYLPIGDYSVLSWLGDVLPVRALRMSMLLSPGDVALAVGVVTAIVAAMLPSAECETSGTGQDT